MDRLPLETVTNICSNLDRRSLLNVAISSRQNREASKTFLFQHVRIDATDGNDLKGACERWKSFLRNVNSAQHMRCLEIRASLQPKNPPPRRDAGDSPRTYYYLLRRTDGLLADKHCNPEFRNVLTPVQVEAIVLLITTLRGLKHLTWDCPWQPIPPALLDILERTDCRLNLPTFRLHSLLRRPTQPVEIDRYDLRLATSPCLESVSLRYDVKEDAFENYNYDALLDMVAGASPNLRNVTLEPGSQYLATQGHTDDREHSRGPRKPWPANMLPKQRSSPLGTLRHLELRRWMGRNDLLKFSTVTDFSFLCSLYIKAGVEEMYWLADRLHSLDTLDIDITRRDGSDSEELQTAAKAFFIFLPPLNCLTLRGIWTSGTLESVLGRHGPTLQKLLFPECTSPVAVELVQRSCPILEELCIPVQRTQGDAQEVSIYHTLGCLPVRRLTLSLRQTDTDHTHKHFSETWQLWDPPKLLQDKFSEFELRKLLINCAVDEALARAIFTKIASRKNHLGLPRLEALDLHPERFSPLFSRRGYPQALLLPIAHLYRSWSCVHNFRDNCEANDCVAEQRSPPGLSLPPSILLRSGMDLLGEFMSRGLDYNALDSRVEETWRSIWPESGLWQNIWHSLPLATAC